MAAEKPQNNVTRVMDIKADVVPRICELFLKDQSIPSATRELQNRHSIPDRLVKWFQSAAKKCMLVDAALGFHGISAFLISSAVTCVSTPIASSYDSL